jgi:hypothetical protein
MSVLVKLTECLVCMHGILFLREGGSEVVLHFVNNLYVHSCVHNWE